MRFKSLSIAVLTTSLISNAGAASFLHDFIPSKQASYPEHGVTKPVTNEDYADFSGDWVGKCNNQPDDEFLRLHIKNNMNAMTINDQHYDLNGINSHTNNTYYLTEGEHVSFRWNKDMHSLLLNGVYFSQVHYSTESARLETAILHGSLSMDNNQLLLKVNTQAYTDGEAEGRLNQECAFVKQP